MAYRRSYQATTYITPFATTGGYTISSSTIAVQRRRPVAASRENTSCGPVSDPDVVT
jgi:hypothetical protein